MKLYFPTLTLILTLAVSAPAADFYVAPGGDDSNPGTKEQPFRTLLRARTAVRDIKWRQNPAYKDNPVGDITVWLRGGRYYQPQTLLLTHNDSSNYGHGITYRNYPNEVPVLVGGVKLPSQWEHYKGGIHKLRLPCFSWDLLSFHQLFENDRPAAPARAPNDGWFRMYHPMDNSFYYRPGDFDPAGWDVGSLRIKQMEASYFSSYQEIARIDAAQHAIVLRQRPNYPFPPPKKMKKAGASLDDNNIAQTSEWEGQRYLVEGALPLLDQPGEFFLDRKSGTLYYWPYHQDINRQEIVIPTVESVIEFRGLTWEQPVHDITIQGLQIQVSRTGDVWHNGWNKHGDNGHPDPDTLDRHSYDEPQDWGLVRLRNAERVRIRDCRLLYAGMYAVSITDGAEANRIEACEIAYSGMGGVLISGPFSACGARKSRLRTDICQNTVVHNNYIHHLGRLYVMGDAVRLLNAGGTRITNNLCTDLAKSAVMIFPMWHVDPDQTACRNTLIKDNVFLRCLGEATDNGTFYIGATTKDTTVDNNYFGDVWTWSQNTFSSTDERPRQTIHIDFDPGMKACLNTVIRNNLFFGPNHWARELGKPEIESTLTNNYWEVMHEGAASAAYWKNAMAFYEKLMKHSLEARPDMSKIHRETMGLTKDFVYPVPREMLRPCALPLYAGFEGTLSPFYLYRYSGSGLTHGADEYLTRQAGLVRDGLSALSIKTDVCMVRYRHPAPIHGKVAVYFYDIPARKTAKALLFVRHGDPDVYWNERYTDIKKSPLDRTVNHPFGWLTAKDERMVAAGVDGAVSEACYTVCVDGKAAATSIPRTAGWHKLEARVDSAKGTLLLIDGKAAGASSILKAFNSVDLGDPDFGSDSRGLGFDTFSIE